jgi:hypothetical protein
MIHVDTEVSTRLNQGGVMFIHANSENCQLFNTNSSTAMLWISFLLCVVALIDMLFSGSSHSANFSGAFSGQSAGGSSCSRYCGYFEVESWPSEPDIAISQPSTSMQA